MSIRAKRYRVASGDFRVSVPANSPIEACGKALRLWLDGRSWCVRDCELQAPIVVRGDGKVAYFDPATCLGLILTGHWPEDGRPMAITDGPRHWVAAETERAYRRGFAQGAYQAVKAWMHGAMIHELQAWLERTLLWRWRALAFDTGHLVEAKCPDDAPRVHSAA